MALRVLFRVDAARIIGHGHVMRCLGLAQALREKGHDCRFVCRQRQGDLIGVIKARGFECITLPESTSGAGEHSWLGVTMAEEIAQSREVIAADCPDWLVVDHYALDRQWEEAVTSGGTKILVLDDLADRPHHCDMLLDPGLAYHVEDYSNLTPGHCRLLLGPAFALLRGEFSRLRQAAKARKRNWPPSRILVNFGGIDPDNATQAVLQSLAGTSLPASTRINVIMGRNAPHFAAVNESARASRFDIDLEQDVTEMAERMLAADLAIGASGSTSWERACLGLPSLILSIAENQFSIAQELERAGAGLDLGPFRQAGWQERLDKALAALGEPGRLQDMSKACFGLVDGRGIERVVQALEALPLAVRPCRAQDGERVWQWREADGAARFYRSGKPTPWETHCNWYEAALDGNRHRLFIVEENGTGVACLRFEMHDSELPELSLAVDPGRKGEGLGLRTVALAIGLARQSDWQGLAAEVHQDNAASRRVFEQNGFRPVSRRGAFLCYQLQLSRGEAR